MLGFMYRNCGIYEDAIVRVTFFHLLSDGYKKVTALSDCRKETRSVKEEAEVRQVMKEAPASFRGDWFVGMDEAAAIFRPYKFAFAMDNSVTPGAVSEKLVNAYLAPSVPIFYGGIDIAQHLNRDAFIYCNISYRPEWERPVWRAAHKKANWFPLSGKFNYDQYLRAEKEFRITDMRVENLKPRLLKDAQPCITQIKSLDNDDAAYKRMLGQSLVQNDRVKGSIFDLAALGRRMRAAMVATEVSNLQKNKRTIEEY